jgi:hypothetical protein
MHKADTRTHKLALQTYIFFVKEENQVRIEMSNSFRLEDKTPPSMEGLCNSCQLQRECLLKHSGNYRKTSYGLYAFLVASGRSPPQPYARHRDYVLSNRKGQQFRSCSSECEQSSCILRLVEYLIFNSGKPITVSLSSDPNWSLVAYLMRICPEELAHKIHSTKYVWKKNENIYTVVNVTT